MTKTLLSSVATLAFLLAAPSAFAQDADVETDSEVVETAEDAMDDAADAAEDMTEDAMDAAEDTMEDAADAMDGAEDAVEDAVESNAHATVEVGCPDGTEAQDDGTCMVTGDWSPED